MKFLQPFQNSNSVFWALAVCCKSMATIQSLLLSISCCRFRGRKVKTVGGDERRWNIKPPFTLDLLFMIKQGFLPSLKFVVWSCDFLVIYQISEQQTVFDIKYLLSLHVLVHQYHTKPQSTTLSQFQMQRVKRVYWITVWYFAKHIQKLMYLKTNIVDYTTELVLYLFVSTLPLLGTVWKLLLWE